MAKVYARMIIAGRYSLDNVPLKWREEVENILTNQGFIYDKTTDSATEKMFL